jgi:hypothetical protein
MLAHLSPRPIPLRDRLLWWIEEALWRQAILCCLAVLMLVLMLPTGISFMLDDLASNGGNAWIRALKLQVALFLYFAILTWLWGYIDTPVRDGRILNGLIVVAAALALLEVAWILAQAARGGPSLLGSWVDGYLDPMKGIRVSVLTLLFALTAIAIVRRPAPAMTSSAELPLLKQGGA